MLQNAGVGLKIDPARIDEGAIRDALLAETAPPRDIADALAEAKARRISSRHAGQLVLGADQVLDLNGETLSKAENIQDAKRQLNRLSDQTHKLHSAAVMYEDGRAVWRHIGSATLRMRPLSDAFIDEYLERNWDSVQHSVGCYKIEEEGPRLFSVVQGSHFAILGLPLIEVLSYLNIRGRLTT